MASCHRLTMRHTEKLLEKGIWITSKIKISKIKQFQQIFCTLPGNAANFNNCLIKFADKMKCKQWNEFKKIKLFTRNTFSKISIKSLSKCLIIQHWSEIRNIKDYDIY